MKRKNIYHSYQHLKKRKKSNVTQLLVNNQKLTGKNLQSQDQRVFATYMVREQCIDARSIAMVFYYQ